MAACPAPPSWLNRKCLELPRVINPQQQKLSMPTPSHKHVPGTVKRIRNRCWSCDKGGSVGIHRLKSDDKDSVRAVHFNVKCINDAKEKYKSYIAAK